MQKQLPTLWPLENDCHKFLALIAAGRSTSHYRKNTAIFVQGADADTVIYIQEGQVKVTVTSEHGKEAILAILGPGQFFGEGCLNGQRHRKATTTTMTDCRLTSIEKDSMLEALHDQPGFSKFFMDHLLSRNGKIEGDVIDQLLIRAKSGWPAFCCCSPTTDKKAVRRSSPLLSTKKRSPK
jgi:CRP/FNR family transcriptional regulator, cyclic AMP receptor protein